MKPITAEWVAKVEAKRLCSSFRKTARSVFEIKDV